MKYNSRVTIILTFIIVIGLFLRLFGIKFGLPYLYGPDEDIIVTRSCSMLESIDLNPHWFGWPGTTAIYLLSLLYIIIYITGVLTGYFNNTGDFSLLYFNDPTLFYLSGRIFFALLGTASIFLVYKITSRIFNQNTALLASILLAISPLHVYHSKIIRPDILMTFLILVVFWFCLDILKKKTWKSYILAGLFAGFAVATKYPAVIIFLVILAAYIFSKSWNDYPKLVISAVSSFLGAFLGSPYLFLDFRTVYLNILSEARPRHLSATGEGFIQNLGWYIQGPLLDSITFVGLILAILGFFLSIYSKKKEQWLLIIFPLFLLLFISNLNLRWSRWIIPVVPFLCIFAAHFFNRALYSIEEISNYRISNIIGSILLLVILIPLLRTDIIRGNEMRGTDTRTLTREWIMDNIPKGSNVLLEKDAPEFPKERFELFVVKNGNLDKVDTENIRHSTFRLSKYVQNGKLNNIQSIHDNNIDYMILSTSWYYRYKAEKENYADYAKIVNTYEILMRMGPKVYEIQRVPGKNRGPTIRIYKFD